MSSIFITELERESVSGRMCVCAHSVMSESLLLHRLWPARLLCPWNFPGGNTGAGYHFLLQGIFLTQGSSPHLLHLLHWHCATWERECNKLESKKSHPTFSFNIKKVILKAIHRKITRDKAGKIQNRL